MIVTAALAWFDEPLDELDRCIRALPTVADRLVALDGGYRRFPGAKAASPRAQAALIRETAREVGIDVRVVVPGQVWAGQCAKRTVLLNLAADGSDWIVGVDTDHVLHGCREAVRWELEQIDDADAVDVSYYTPLNRDRPLDESAAGDWHRDLAGQYADITALFRALPNYRVERHHWWYSAEKDGRRIWIWGGDMTLPRTRTHSLDAPFFVEHRCLFRQPKQIMRNRVFCQDRVRLLAEQGQEDPVEDQAAA